MSQKLPSLPIQEPVVTNNADDTTQAQRQALFGASNLGHVERRRSRVVSPPSSANHNQERHANRHQHALAPLQLPPIRPPAKYDTGHVEKRMPIAGMLSASPLGRQSFERRVQSQPHDFQAPPTLTEAPRAQHSPLARYEYPATGIRHHEIPRPWRAPPPFHQSPASPHRNPAVVSWQPQLYPGQPDPGQPVHSPTNTIGSFAPSHHSGSSEQSPSVRSASAYTPNPVPTVSQPPPDLNYHLSIRQHPIAARACGYGERDRRVIDPPPILQLRITGKETGAPEQDNGAMLAVHCTLLSTNGEGGDQAAVDTNLVDAPPVRCLMGTLVASPYQAKDEYGKAGTFFVFSDLSCRKPGTYKLEFKMLRVDPTLMQAGNKVGVVATVESQTFTVYQAKDFPGMKASTALLTALREQGLAVGLKKGSEVRISKGRKRQQSESSAESGESESEGGRPASNGSGKQSSSDKATPKRRTKNKSKT